MNLHQHQQQASSSLSCSSFHGFSTDAPTFWPPRQQGVRQLGCCWGQPYQSQQEGPGLDHSPLALGEPREEGEGVEVGGTRSRPQEGVEEEEEEGAGEGVEQASFGSGS